MKVATTFFLMMTWVEQWSANLIGLSVSLTKHDIKVLL